MILIVLLVMGGLTAHIASGKGRNGFLWFCYGVVIWPVAIIHALAMDRTPQAIEWAAMREGRVKCPLCAEFVKREATRCPHCRSEIEPPARIRRVK